VAAGVFAAGHLGELTRIVPFEMADAVLEEAPGARERRVRLLPSRAGLYFLLAMCLFPRVSYLGVWGKLTAALDGLGLAVPSPKALRDLRRRIGIAPVRRLFEILAGPQGQPRTPGIMFGGYRTVSFDGCKSIKVPGRAANRAWLGKQNASNGETGYPALSLMTLVETGTRALLGAVFGPGAEGETGQARDLLPLLDQTMLVLIDRGFDGGDFLAAVAAARAQFLVRLTSTRRLPVLRHLPDGSFTSLIGGVKVRVITAKVTVTCHDGTTYGGVYRLATTLLDHRAYPAGALMALYHERWQHEITYLALRHTVLQGRGAAFRGSRRHRAGDVGAAGPLPGAAHRSHRRRQSVPGTDPDRASYQAAVETAQNLVTTARNITGPASDLPGDIGRAVLASLHGPRRPRVCVRKVKSPLSRWNKHPDGKPRTTCHITGITTHVDASYHQPATRRRKSVTAAEGP